MFVLGRSREGVSRVSRVSSRTIGASVVKGYGAGKKQEPPPP